MSLDMCCSSATHMLGLASCVPLEPAITNDTLAICRFVGDDHGRARRKVSQLGERVGAAHREYPCRHKACGAGCSDHEQLVWKLRSHRSLADAHFVQVSQHKPNNRAAPFERPSCDQTIGRVLCLRQHRSREHLSHAGCCVHWLPWRPLTAAVSRTRSRNSLTMPVNTSSEIF